MPNTPNDDYTDKLQFTGHEEGRIRAIYNNSASPNTISGFAYDYMVKDHLGNVRMVLTEEQKTNFYPAATLEGIYSAEGTTQANSMVNYEKQFYKIDNTKIVTEGSIPSWPTETVANTKQYYNNNGNPPANLSYPTGCTPVQTAGSNTLYKLNATANKTGLEFVIKVMAGDKVDIFGKSYYLNTASITNANSTTLNLSTLISSFLLAPTNPAGSKGATETILQNINTGVIPNTFFTGSNNEASTTIPKAYINYIFFDEQFKYSGGGVSRVGTSGTVKDHWQTNASLQGIVAPKNGYIFVYVSNESNLDVFFDNLQVIHTPGPILEETHYYPFGLTMAGISSKAAGGLENKKKFNDGSELQSKEFSDGSGLEMYDTHFRQLDPQIGRWWQIDPKPNDNESPYAAMGNNPIFNNDPLGDTIIISAAMRNNKAAMAAFNLFKQSDDFKNTYGQFDIAGGFFGGDKDGSQSANTNVTLDIYSNTDDGGGVTKFQVQDKDGNWQNVPTANGKNINSDSKVNINIFINPKQLGNDKTKIADVINHEANVHGTPFLKTLNVLRNEGGVSFMKEWKSSSSLGSRDNASTIGLRYNGPSIPHAQAALGLNPNYNATGIQVRNQLSPSDQKRYDAIIRNNPRMYRDDINIYKNVLKR